MLYYKIKEVTRSSPNVEHPVKDIDGCLLSSAEDQMLRWRSHFSSVLNHHLPEDVPPYTGHQTQIRTNTRISIDAPTIAEIIDAIKLRELMVYQRSF